MSGQTPLGMRVKQVWQESGRSQEDFASSVGLSRTGLTNIMNGDADPRASTVQRIAHVAERPVGWFYLETPLQDPAPPGEQNEDRLARLVEVVAQSQAQVADAVTQMAQALASLKSDLADTHRRLDSLTDDCRQGVKSVHDALDELADKVDDLAEVERGVLKQRLDQVEHELYQEGLEGGATKGAA